MAEILVYGEIGFEVVDVDVLAQIKALDVNEPLTIAINSPGGAVFDAEAIGNALRRHKGQVTARVDGLAASAAAFLMLFADRRVAASGAQIMFHWPWTFTRGNANDLRKAVERLESVGRVQSERLARVSGQAIETVRQWLDGETWFSAEQAAEVGLLDEIEEELKIAACCTGDFTKFGPNMPAPVRMLAKQIDLTAGLRKQAEKVKAPTEGEAQATTTDVVVDDSILIESARLRARRHLGVAEEA